jgi:hypothetical protein
MLRSILAWGVLTLFGSYGVQAHTTGQLHPHPHPHSMDFFADGGVAVFALMLVAIAVLFAVSRWLSRTSRSTTNRRRR